MKALTMRVLVAALTTMPCVAGAEVTAVAHEVGGDVVIEASGTLNLDEWTFGQSANASGQIDPSSPAVVVGGRLVPVDIYDTPPGSYSRPDNFGSGGSLVAQTGTGDLFGFRDPNSIFVPQGYVSGEALSGTTTFRFQTFFSLGMEVGSYTWSWGQGATSDSFTLIITTEVATDLSSWGRVKALYN